MKKEATFVFLLRCCVFNRAASAILYFGATSSRCTVYLIFFLESNGCGRLMFLALLHNFIPEY
jgi:hypothetical protein